MNYDIMNLPETVDPQTFTTAGSTYDGNYYDHVQLHPGIEEYNLFKSGFGEVDPTITAVTTTKTKADTNFPGKNLDTGVGIFIYGFGIKYQNDEVRTVDEYQAKVEYIRDCYYEVMINSRSAYGDGTLDYMYGEGDDQVISLASGDFFAYKNVGQTKGFLPLNYIIPVAKQTNFGIQITPYTDLDAGLEDDRLKWELINITNRLAL